MHIFGGVRTGFLVDRTGFPGVETVFCITTWVRRGYCEAHGRIAPPPLAEGCVNIKIRNK